MSFKAKYAKYISKSKFIFSFSKYVIHNYNFYIKKSKIYFRPFV